jgi:hypothetical protein
MAETNSVPPRRRAGGRWGAPSDCRVGRRSGHARSRRPRKTPGCHRPTSPACSRTLGVGRFWTTSNWYACSLPCSSISVRSPPARRRPPRSAACGAPPRSPEAESGTIEPALAVEHSAVLVLVTVEEPDHVTALERSQSRSARGRRNRRRYADRVCGPIVERIPRVVATGVPVDHRLAGTVDRQLAVGTAPWL